MSHNRDEKNIYKNKLETEPERKRNSEKNLLRYQKAGITWRNWNRCLVQ